MTGASKQVEVVPYDPRWPQQYVEEAGAIAAALQGNLIAIHHVGSTAVAGLPAKPKIDILAVVQRPDAARDALAAIGYLHRGEYNIPFQHGFSKRTGVQVNLHLFGEGHPEVELNLLFRDCLRAQPSLCSAYAALKQRLLHDPAAASKEGALYNGYNLGKDASIHQALRQAGFSRLRFLHCTHRLEWEAARQLRQRHFFDHVPTSDPYTWTFNHPAHRHFVLCRGVDIIGYGHVQLWTGQRAAVRIIVIDTPHRGQGFGSHFLRQIEAWLRQQGIVSLHTEASPAALRFYEAAGYTDMPFDDPEGYEGGAPDVPMGKLLRPEP